MVGSLVPLGMWESRIIAVDHVNVEAPPGAADGLRWFYGEVCLLDEVDASVGGAKLVYRSGRIELRIHLLGSPVVEPVDCRVGILVPELSEATELLEERRVGYDTLSGLTWTDQRISLLDPGGNRVELRQYWPRITL